jgi:type VI secretion system Hcp family effector
MGRGAGAPDPGVIEGKQTGRVPRASGFQDAKGLAATHQFETFEFSFATRSPRDAASGQSAGRRVYLPVTFIKANGPSTPQFYQALLTNESLPLVIFDCYGKDQGGSVVLVHSIKLVNASVASIDFVKPNLRDPQKQAYAECEEIALTFEKFEMTHGTTVVDDDWKA